VAYSLETDESVRAGVLRSAGEQLDQAVRELTVRVDDDPVEAVHSARKAVKKERSLLRLARGSLDRDQRRRENGALRHAARSLSTARDGEAMLETLDDLSERFVGRLPETTFQKVRERLESRRDKERRELIGSSVAGLAADELHAVRARQGEWKFAEDGWPAIEQGLRRSYRDGRKLFSHIRSKPSSGEWHAWRKRVKDLWYQERLLAAVAGPAVKGQAKDAHALADLLGDEHDLDVLGTTLQSERMTPPVDLDAVIELIEFRRRELRADAVRLGARIYAEKPKRFVRRMRSSWEAGCAQERASRDRDPAELGRATARSPLA
jgi:CHAD domain-containing protein